jgi:DNA-binding NarL/FixJ family response regulator
MSEPKSPVRLALLDDDPVASEIVRARIRAACPDIVVAVMGEPVVVPGFDIYVIDNSFGGIKQGSRLADAIATVAPEAALFILSSYLEVELLKRALGSRCRGAFEKGNPTDMSSLVHAIGEVAAELQSGRRQRPAHRGLVADIAALIGEWNARMNFEERRRSKGEEQPLRHGAAGSSRAR